MRFHNSVAQPCSRGLSLSHRRTISSWMEFNLSGRHGAAAAQAGGELALGHAKIPFRHERHP